MINKNLKFYEKLSVTNLAFNKVFLRNLKKVLKTGMYINGEFGKKLERDFSKFVGVKFSIGVSNGLDGLVVGLNALKKVRKKKNLNEVLVPANTYIASIISIIHAGLKPVLVEPNINDYNINLEIAKKKITKNTLAIMPVHLYGRPVDYKKLRYFKKKKIFVIEDASQAHGANINGKMVGSFGDLAVFSCYPGKNLGSIGDAGIITTNSRKLDNILRTLKNYGSKKKYYNEYVGFNNRMDEIQAAFLIEKLKSLKNINKKKILIANTYDKLLDDRFIKPPIDKNYNVFHIYPIRVKNRKKFIKFLEKQKVPFNIHYPVAPHKQKALKNLIKNKKFPITEKIHETIVSLPIASYFSQKKIKEFCLKINKFND